MIAIPMPATLEAPAERFARSEGVHASKIIRAIALQNGSLKAEFAPDTLSLTEAQGESKVWWDNLKPQDRLRIGIGLAWEEWYIKQLVGVTDHPGEMFLDGIYLTHDGESIDAILTEQGEQAVIAVHECKATYKSTKTIGDLSTQWMLLAQIKAYCKALNTLVAYVHILFLCGDYSYPLSPVLKVWRVEFTQVEVDDNWDTFTTFVRHFQQQEAENAMRDTYDAR